MEIGNRVRPIYKEENEDQPKMISIITGKMCARINISDIEYIEQEYRLLHIVTAETDYIVYENIKTILELLKGRSEFYRALKNFVINFDHVKSMEDVYVCFESGREYAMGRNNICRTRNVFRRYLQGYPAYPNYNVRSMVAEKPSKT